MKTFCIILVGLLLMTCKTQDVSERITIYKRTQGAPNIPEVYLTLKKDNNSYDYFCTLNIGYLGTYIISRDTLYLIPTFAYSDFNTFINALSGSKQSLEGVPVRFLIKDKEIVDITDYEDGDLELIFGPRSQDVFKLLNIK